MTPACKVSPHKVEGFEVQGHPMLHRKIKATLGYDTLVSNNLKVIREGKKQNREVWRERHGERRREAFG